ncbi:hypothetical protein C8R45DRAFT_988187 [Mycena sanguinolenta]|nr:hypothetical protein C8R45DRAFT_988187 [Mycena sanguinolenta]
MGPGRSGSRQAGSGIGGALASVVQSGPCEARSGTRTTRVAGRAGGGRVGVGDRERRRWQAGVRGAVDLACAWRARRRFEDPPAIRVVPVGFGDQSKRRGRLCTVLPALEAPILRPGCSLHLPHLHPPTLAPSSRDRLAVALAIDRRADG